MHFWSLTAQKQPYLVKSIMWNHCELKGGQEVPYPGNIALVPHRPASASFMFGIEGWDGPCLLLWGGQADLLDFFFAPLLLWLKPFISLSLRCFAEFQAARDDCLTTIDRSPKTPCYLLQGSFTRNNVSIVTKQMCVVLRDFVGKQVDLNPIIAELQIKPK